MKSKEKIVTPLIIMGLLLIVCLPYFFEVYDFTNACIITFSTIMGGAAGGYITKRFYKGKK